MSKVKTRLEFIAQFPKIYFHLRSTKQLTMLDSFFPPRRTTSKWTFSDWVALSDQYSSIGSFAKDYPGLYVVVRRNKWYVKHNPFMDRKIKWKTKDQVIKALKKYKTIDDLHRNNNGLYVAAKNRFKLVIKDFIAPLKGKSVINLDLKKVFGDAVSAGAFAKVSEHAIRCACRGKYKTAGGYRWAYCDENGKILKKRK